MKSSLIILLPIVFVSQCFASHVDITTDSLPNGTVKTEYSATITASGGCLPYKWALVSGSLPAGVTKKPSTTTTSLEFTGTPTTAASYSFTISVTGCGGYVSTVSYKVVIQSTANHVVDLSWKASTSKDIAGYNIYRSTNDATWERLNASLVASTVYSDSTVANDTVYYYAATTVNTSGEESAKTAAIKVSVP
jgi:hypothetical protein